LLDCLRGPSPGDPYYAEPPVVPYLQAITQPVRRLKIAMTRHSLIGTKLHPDCVAATLDAAKLCEAQGHTVIEGRATAGMANILLNIIAASGLDLFDGIAPPALPIDAVNRSRGSQGPEAAINVYRMFRHPAVARPRSRYDPALRRASRHPRWLPRSPDAASYRSANAVSSRSSAPHGLCDGCR